MITLDGNGMAAIIAAGAAGMVSVGTFVMQAVAWADARKIKNATAKIAEAGDMREQKLDTLHAQINGRMTELKIKIAKEAYEMGRKYERDNPGAQSPDFPKPLVEEYLKEKEDA